MHDISQANKTVTESLKETTSLLQESNADVSDSSEPRSSKRHRQENLVHGRTVQTVLGVWLPGVVCKRGKKARIRNGQSKGLYKHIR